MDELIVGFHAIEESLKDSNVQGTLYICRNMEKRNERLISMAKMNKQVAVRKIAKVEMDRLAKTDNHRGALLITKISKESSFTAEISVKNFLLTLKEDSKALVLVLDGITDVHNLGAILRSADQFSVDLVVIPQRRSAQTNETVARISSGASRYVKIATVTNIVREIETLQKEGFWVYGADMGGSSLFTTKFPARTVLVVGSEGSGLSQLVTKRCDHIVAIPTTGNIDSLNVSVATGILLYEVRRQNS
jgi:23S rRNA (guanosine2251-2'-O)-methyltransferase